MVVLDPDVAPRWAPFYIIGSKNLSLIIEMVVSIIIWQSCPLNGEINMFDWDTDLKYCWW